jgi:hypothetical protein
MADIHDVELVKLQMAMAFGQGAGSMLAAEEAIGQMFATNNTILTTAMINWDQSRWAFTELMRLIGQVAATRAATAGRAYINYADIEGAVSAALILCPCMEIDGVRAKYPVR